MEKSMLIWSHYLFQAELLSRDSTRIFIRFDQDFRDFPQLLSKLSHFLGVTLTPEMKKKAEAFYTPELQHHNVSMQNISGQLPTYLKKMVELLLQAKWDNQQQLDHLREDFNNSVKFYLHNQKQLLAEKTGLQQQLDTATKNHAQDLKKIEATNKSQKDNLKLLEASNGKLFASNQRLTQESKSQLEKISSQKQNLLDLSNNNNALQQENLQLDNNLKALTANNKGLLTQLNKLKNDLKGQQDLNEQLKNTCDQLQHKLDKQKKKQKKKIQKLKKQRNSLQQYKVIQQQNTKQLNESIKNLDHKLTQQINKNKNYRIEIAVEKKKLDAANKQIKVLNNEIKDINNSVKRNNKALVIAEQNKVDHIKRISELKNRLLIGELFLNKIFFNQTFSKQISQNFSQPSRLKLVLSKVLSSKDKAQLLNDRNIIIGSSYFSPFYYLTRYQDVWDSGIDPLDHFCLYGWKESRDPNPSFSIKSYLNKYDDVKKSGINPLVHYILHGEKENRETGYSHDLGEYETSSNIETASSIVQAKPPKSNPQISQDQTNNKSSKAEKQAGMIKTVASAVSTEELVSSKPVKTKPKNRNHGEIESFQDGYIKGISTSAESPSTPVIKINNIPCVNLAQHDSTGFVSKTLSSVKNSRIELLSLSEKGILSQHKLSTKNNWNTTDKFADLKRAQEISKNPNAVAITVWEGAHNPIGRAKVLYEILASKRPVVLFAYVFGDFGRDIWGPLKNSDINVVLIPYAQRLSYQSYIQQHGIYFNSIWICKYRLHSFELASMISQPDSACILDIDDNEDAFISSDASTFKPYGIFSKNKADYFLNRTQARSVASQSINNIYAGELVRHARRDYADKTPIKLGFENLTAVFIGTIRPHKNITQLVSAIAKYNKTADLKVKLAIGGDFDPPTLKQSLKTADTIILGSITSENLYQTLAQYDVIITGYPDDNQENHAINSLQISSKIGDGLAIGRPVLTPLSPSVADLEGIDGLFLFNKTGFAQALSAALKHKTPIELPKEFSLDHGYKTFLKLEKQAQEKSLAKNIFGLEPFYSCQHQTTKPQKNIVLIWKQHDAGIYGRRIDHIARYYKQRHPHSKVTIIELISDNDLTRLMKSNIQFDNFSVLINDVLAQKLCKYSIENVEYKLITYADPTGWNSFEAKFKYFLDSQNIYPDNSLMILFPLHHVFNKLIATIKDYRTIVDLVDNQIKWISKADKRIEGLKQYYDLITIADEVVSNSEQNLQYFKKLNFLKDKKPKVIHNWYTIPQSIPFNRDVYKDEINLLYSGNLNDRIDWQLMHQICQKLEKYNGKLHIVGTSIRSSDNMQKLLKNSNCVYHGVVSELHLLRLLQHINFTVVPHIEDSISKFMDPIKLKMYKKLGIKSLTSKLPGLPTNDNMIIVTETATDFLHKMDEMLNDKREHSSNHFKRDDKDVIGDSYIKLIENLFKKTKKEV